MSKGVWHRPRPSVIGTDAITEPQPGFETQAGVHLPVGRHNGLPQASFL